MNATNDWGAKARELLADRGIVVPVAKAFELVDAPAIAVPDLRPIFDRLMEAAMVVCDHHKDGVDARAEMERNCRGLMPRLQADLLDHFQQVLLAANASAAWS